MQEWRNNHPQVNILHFPTKSFDINPMNIIWNAFKRELYLVPRSEIREAVVDAWHEMKEDPYYFKGLYFGMKRTMERVIEMHGAFII